MSYPVNWFERFNAAFVLVITPEMRKVRAAQGARPKRLPEGKISMPLERRTIAGVDVRIALGGNSDGHTLLMLCPLPQSIVAFEPIWQLLKDCCNLVALDLPVQIFWGDLDQLLYVENAKVLERRLPRSRLRVFEQCGHYSYQDRAEQFAQMVSTWVDGEYQTI